MKKAAGFFTGLGLFIFAVLFSLSLALNTNDARQVLLARVNALIPGTLAMDHLSVSLFAGSVEAVHLALTAPDKTPLLYVDHVSFNLSWLGLLFRTISIDDVVIDEPRVYLDMGQDNTLNIVRAFVDDSESEASGGASGGQDENFPFNIELHSLDLRDGSATFSLEGKETVGVEHVALKVVDANLAQQTGVVGLSLGPGRIQANGLDIQIDHLDLGGHLDGNRLSSLLVDILSKDGHVTLTGDIQDAFTDPGLDLTLDLVHENLSQLDQDFGLSLGLDGKAKIHARIKGAYDNPEATMVISASEARFLDRSISSLDVSASLADRNVRLEALSLDMDLGRATATGTLDLNNALDPVDLFSGFQAYKAIYEVDLQADVPFVERIPYVDGIARGPVSAYIEARGQGFVWGDIRADADVRAESTALSFLETPLSTYALNGRVALKDKVLSTDGAWLKNGETQLALHGEYRFDSFTYEGDLDLVSDDLSGFALIKPYGDYSGRLDVKTHWADTGESWQGHLSGNGKDISSYGTYLGDLVAVASLDNTGVLTVERCDAGYSDFSVHGNGRLGLFGGDNRLDVTLDVIQADIPVLLNVEGMSAVADGHVTLTGTWDDPRLDAMVTGDKLGLSDLALGRVTSSLSYETGRIIFSETTLTNHKSELTASGSLRVLDPKALTLLDTVSGEIQVAGPGLFLEDFYEGLSGQVTLDGHITGQPGNMAGHIIVRGEQLDVMGQAVKRVQVESLLEHNDVLVDRAVISMAPGEDIRLSGRLSLDNMGYQVAVDSDNIAIRHLAQLGSQSLCKGKVGLALSGQGTLDDPALKGKVMLSDVAVNNKDLGAGEIGIVLADHTLDLTGSLIAEVKAGLDLNTYDFNAMAHFDKTDLAPFFRIGGYDELEGEVTGEARSWGRLTEPETIRAETRVSSISVRSGSFDLVRDGTVRFVYGDQAFDFTGTRFELQDEGEFVLDGKGRIGGDVSFDLNGKIPLGILNPVVEDLADITGEVRVRATLTGSMEAPVLGGDMSLEGVSFLIPELMQQVHGVSGRIHAAADHVTLERLTGGLDRGHFDVRGRLDLDHLKPGNLALTIKGEALPFSVPDVLDVTVNSSMTFSGTPEDTRLEGSVMLIEGRYYKDVSMNFISMVSEKSRNVAVESQPILTPYLKNMILDVSLRHRNPFDVDNNIAYLELMPDLNLYGTLNQPLISGRAQVGDGVVTYQGREFEVNKGVVDFLNPYKIEPTIDVACEVEVREWVITLSVSGTPDNLKFTLTSNPSETDGDILSLLLFGKTTSEVREGGGGASVSAAQLLATAISRNLEKNLKDATGMDIVKVEYSNTSSESSENGISVTIGKELSDRLTLKYEVESKDTETVQKAISEYKFLENLLINAFQDTGNDYGAELVYRLEFR